jgi:hypothetical protein
MSKQANRFYVRLLSVAVLVALLSVIAPSHFVGADAQVVFDSIPATLPGSFMSVGYQATQTDELGDNIAFTVPAGNNKLTTVTVSLTNWSCENDFDLVDGVWVPNRAGNEACVTTPGSGFTHPITLNLYNVYHSGEYPAVGTLLASKTINATIPFRPSYDSVQCSANSPENDIPFGGTWFDPVQNKCVHGRAFTIDFDFTADNFVLPSEIIFGIAYNTSSYGTAPTGVVGPYDSLNLSLGTASPTVGTDVEPKTLFYDTRTASNYCDSGAGGVNIFRRDADCWEDGNSNSFVPVIRFSSYVDNQGPLASAVAVTDDDVAFGSPAEVTLTANLDDATTGGAFIASAEFRVSPQTTWMPMTAVDGAFNSSVVENVQASFLPDALGLTEGGDYELCVRGTDTEGNTGEEACTPFSIHYFIYLPVIQH